MNHKGTRPLKTDRLEFCRFTVDDADAVYNTCMFDEEVTKFLRLRREVTLQSTHEIVSKWVRSYEEKDVYNWALVLTQTKELIGYIQASVQNDADGIGEVGYCLGRRFWNRGYATEALQAVLHFLIFEVGFNRIEACCSVNNPASGRVLQKAGMTLEGTLRQSYLCSLGYQDSHLYSILRDDFDVEGQKQLAFKLDIV